MVPQLPTGCLNEIFNFFENDKIILHSYLLVNCLWCEISARTKYKKIAKGKKENNKNKMKEIVNIKKIYI